MGCVKCGWFQMNSQITSGRKLVDQSHTPEADISADIILHAHRNPEAQFS